MRVRLETLGCRLNIGEVEAMARQLACAGHRLVPPGETADLCVLNSCTVTASAARKSRHLLHQLRRANPNAALVLTGCYAELQPDRVRLAGADLVVGNADKDRLVQILEERGLLTDADPVPDVDASPTPVAAGWRTRAFVKVQDGCDNRCAFCIVTVARGASRSRPAEDIVRQIRELTAEGYREAVLSGVHLGSYGHDLGQRDGLSRLVRRILAETELPRLRLSSVEPWDLDDGFFELFSDPRVLPHLHLPLQSGCDTTLRRMARRTTASQVSALIAAARAAHSWMAVTTDVMVAFPGETEEEFEESFSFIERASFARLHVFRYSVRVGTPAARMPGRVDSAVATSRSRRMHELGARLEEEYKRRFLGRRARVLWEDAEPYGLGLRWSGLTPNYLRVLTETPAGTNLLNASTETELLQAMPGAVLGFVPGVSIQSTFAAPPFVRSA
ncbi:MAG: tRNA (N(6)-L-threonylcarbamoyladenosine(37)-C(2))-methylthiotransferase MtaB [Acidobacteria bacterium]|nr:tRNA (N(6)-L-threonylcarbamoyladenosine(37)-C(2))-methylthiotransferase MtaB [Acidobacteriota bacterium]